MRPKANRWAGLGVLCLAGFLVMVDNTIVNGALPTISAELSAGVSGLQWVVDAYTLAFAGLLLTGGYVGDRFGRRRALLVGIVGFGVVSALAASSQFLGELIGARALLGAFAALVFPATLALLTVLFDDPKERSMAIGIWGATSGVAIAAGPLVGGLLLEHFSWAAVFWVNVPVAVVTFCAVLLTIPLDRDKHVAPFDLPGVLLSVGSMSVLVYSFIEGPTWGWGSPTTIAGFVLAAALLLGFVIWESRTAHPILDISLFRNRFFATSSAAISLAYFSLFGFIFLITQYLQAIMDYSPFEAGLRILPFAIVVAGASPLAITLSHKLGDHTTVGIGLLLMSAGFGVALATSRISGYWFPLLPAMCLIAAGLAMIQGPATAIIMNSLAPHQAGAGSAMNDVTREVGGALGVAVLGSILASFYGTQLDSQMLTFPVPAAAEAARASLISGIQAAQSIPGDAGSSLLRIVQDAYVEGLHQALWVAVSATAFSAPLAWLLLRPRRAEASTARGRHV